MAKKPLQPLEKTVSQASALVEECEQHEQDSYNALSTIRPTWDDKMAMLTCKLEDEISDTTKSQVFDPVLSTMLLERTGRVMYQNPSGKAYAVSKDDVGKNILMNLNLKYYRQNANEQYSFLTKLRMLDFYSGVFGTYFGLVPWRVNPDNGYIGPELLLLDMWKIRPQPMKKNLDESDYFGVESDISLAWLQKQAKANPKVWMNIDKVSAQMKAKKDPGDASSADKNRSFVEKEWYPSVFGDAKYPSLKVHTEYRRDCWISWTPKQIDDENSRPHIIRIVRNPYPEGMLPIVAKHAFPLMNSMIGLGEFERGMTLQKAANSLWNLYLDGVKYSIFPPLHINPDEVVPESIKWGAGERWFMNNPNKDVQSMRMSPSGLQTFQPTYGYLMSAVQNLSGSTQVSQPSGTEPTLGKTPEAIKMRGMQSSARDEWDRFMMDESIKEIYKRWIALTTHNLEAPQAMRVFEGEIEDIQKAYPEENILEVFKSGKRGTLTVSKGYYQEKDKEGKKRPVKFDFELEPGSTMKKNIEDEVTQITAIINSLGTKVGPITMLEAIRAQGGDVKILELYKTWLQGIGKKDYDKVLIEPEAKAPGQEGVEQVPPGGQVPPRGDVPVENVPAQSGPVPTEVPKFKDEEIANVANEIFAGRPNGVPPTNQ